MSSDLEASESCRDFTQDIKQLAAGIEEFYEQAYEAYSPLTDDLCGRAASEDEVEYILDRMLDFCGSDKMLRLFKQICRKYFYVYPEMVAFEIKGYRDMYDSDDRELGSDLADTVSEKGGQNE